MNCTPCQIAFVRAAELLKQLSHEELSPEARVMARQAAAAIHVAGVHIQTVKGLLEEPSVRDKAKGGYE